MSFLSRCEYPSKHRGKNLLSIPSEELTCGTRVYKILIIVALAVVVILCFVLFIFFTVRRNKAKKSKQTEMKTFKGTNYTAVYTRDQDDVKVSVSDEKGLLTDSREFDV